MIPFLLWWLIILILGWLALPLAARIFHWLPDRGYTLSKALGLLLTSYILWLGSSTGFLHNDLGGIFFAILSMAFISAWLWHRKSASLSQEESLVNTLIRNRTFILLTEVLFLAAFALWALLRAFAADKIMNAGGEKFMEMAFLNGILNSSTFPPLDPWLSGFGIAYYYFGYVMMAVVTRLSGVPSGVGFDLYDALLFALTVVGSFGIVFNLVSAAQRHRSASNTPRRAGQPVVYGLLGALFTAVLGNLEGLFEAFRSRGFVPDSFFKWIDIPDLVNAPVTGSWYPGISNLWWWWRGSRVIQDFDLAKNPIGVSPITEFPFFSFLLGDNHPHVLGLPFVLMAVSLALNLLMSQVENKKLLEPAQLEKPVPWWNPIKSCLEGDSVLFFFMALLLGGLAFLNTWDFPIYLGLALVAFVTGQAAIYHRLDRQILIRAASLAVGLLLSSILLYLFFYISFDSQAGGILPYIFPPTRLVQYLTMFGVFSFILVVFLILVLIKFGPQGKAARRIVLRTFGWVLLVGMLLYAMILFILAVGSWLAQSAPALQDLQNSLGGIPLSQVVRIFTLDRLKNPWLFLTFTGIVGLVLAALQVTVLRPAGSQAESQEIPSSDPSMLFVLLLVLLGILLSWSVEFFYLRDSFMVRMNTVFKFYYQTWIMLACAAAFALWWLSEVLSGKLLLRGIVFTAAGILILAGMVYPVMAFNTRTDGFTTQPDLDGSSGIARSNPDDWAAIQWLLRNVPTGSHVPIILETPGRSYTYEGRISTFTGFPAVLGWAIHESQWRGSYEEQGQREADIIQIYSTQDPEYALELLNKWDVEYVVVGWPEENYIRQLCADPARHCNPASALRKFDLALQPVFSQGSAKIYAVPGK